MSDKRKEAVKLMLEMMERVRQCLNTDSSSTRMELDTLTKVLAENFGDTSLSNDEVKRQFGKIMDKRKKLSQTVVDSDKKVEAINVVLDLFSKKKKVEKKVVSKKSVQPIVPASVKIELVPEKPSREVIQMVRNSQAFKDLDGTDQLIFFIGSLYGQKPFYTKRLFWEIEKYGNVEYNYIRSTVSWLMKKNSSDLKKRKVTPNEKNSVDHVSGSQFKYQLNTVRGWKKYVALRRKLLK